MNYKTIALVTLVTSLAWGCFDEPRKVKLKGSTFDSIPMKAASFGFNIEDTYNVYYNLQKRTWCIDNYKANKEKCGMKTQILTDDQGNKVGQLVFDDAKKRLVIQQMVSNAVVDGPFLEVTNESDPASVKDGYDRYTVKAKNPDGSMMGELKAAHNRLAKGGLGEEEKPEVDLTQKVRVSSGCGGTGDSNAGTPHKPDVTFEVDDQEQHQ